MTFTLRSPARTVQHPLSMAQEAAPSPQDASEAPKAAVMPPARRCTGCGKARDKWNRCRACDAKWDAAIRQLSKKFGECRSGEMF